MPTKWYEGKVVNSKSLTDSTKQIEVQVLGDDDFDFIPGQFITMDLPIGDKRLDRWRSYSIANAPNPDKILEFCIVRFDNGLASQYLCDEIKVGDTIRFKGPDGGFVLPEDVQRPLIFIATGTGVAPFRGMIQYIFKNNIPFKSMHLIFGTRKASDILYREEFLQLSESDAGFVYSVALSREENINYTKGFVHEVYMDKNYIIPSDALVYICGWTKMIDQAVELLILHKKVNPGNIKYELYG